MWTNLRLQFFRGPRHKGLKPHFCEFYLQKPDFVLTVNIKEKNLLVLPGGGGGGGENHSEIS